MTKDPRLYLAQILECVQRIEEFTAGGWEAFRGELLIQHAVIYNLQVMGEAAKRVDAAYRKEHPEIPWRSMTGLRDVLIHDYEVVDMARVWAVVNDDLPKLKKTLRTILPPLEQLEAELAKDEAD